ncbi:MAG: hypothetical protein ACP6IQ_05985 [Candidatus Njordarchaeia archaeon]|nr:hypothetical protein [Candidatus Korarchaeota archaeon]
MSRSDISYRELLFDEFVQLISSLKDERKEITLRVRLIGKIASIERNLLTLEDPFKGEDRGVRFVVVLSSSHYNTLKNSNSLVGSFVDFWGSVKIFSDGNIIIHAHILRIIESFNPDIYKLLIKLERKCLNIKNGDLKWNG